MKLRPQSKLRLPRGFSLLETLVYLTVLLVVMAPAPRPCLNVGPPTRPLAGKPTTSPTPSASANVGAAICAPPPAPLNSPPPTAWSACAFRPPEGRLFTQSPMAKSAARPPTRRSLNSGSPMCNPPKCSPNRAGASPDASTPGAGNWNSRLCAGNPASSSFHLRRRRRRQINRMNTRLTKNRGPRARNRGSAVVVMLAVLGVMMAFAAANVVTINALRRRVQIVDQRQVQRWSAITAQTLHRPAGANQPPAR